MWVEAREEARRGGWRGRQGLDPEKPRKPCLKINLYHESNAKALRGFKHRSDKTRCAFK